MKEKDEDWVSSHQSKVVKIQEDSRYPPKLKLKIINEGNKQATKFYVANKGEEALMDVVLRPPVAVIPIIPVTLDTFHLSSNWLKDCASLNISSILPNLPLKFN